MVIAISIVYIACIAIIEYFSCKIIVANRSFC